MANWYVDTVLANGAGDGTTTDLAWNSIETAMEYAGFTPGDKTWIKRDSSYLCAGDAQDITPGDDGTVAAPLFFIGWPRAVILNTTITQADFTNGSNIIDNVVGITPTREKHVGRYITAPDGFRYMITAVLWEADVDGMAGGAEFTLGSKLINTTQTKYGKIWRFTDDLDNTGTIQYVRDSAVTFVENDNITDADGGDAEIEVGGETPVGFLIDREYAGSTVTGVNGKFQIEADEDYTEAQAIDDSGFTIKLSTWDDDAHDLPVLDFGNHASQLFFNIDHYYYYKNLELRDSTDANGIVYNSRSRTTQFFGCLFHQDQNAPIVRSGGASLLQLDRCVLEGNLIGVSQVGYLQYDQILVSNTAIYGMGDYGIYFAEHRGGFCLGNVNIGVEMDNGDTDLYIAETGSVIANEVCFGGGINEVVFSVADSSSSTRERKLIIENYNKILGVHKAFNNYGTISKLDVVPGSGDPYKRSGGADSVLNLEYNISNSVLLNSIPEWTVPVFTHEFEATIDSKSYRYYVQCEGIVTADQLYIIAEYVDSYDDATEYTMTTQQSDEAFTARADAEDWAEYMEVTGIQPAIGSKVRIKCFCSYYHASNNIYIDPLCVIS